ncbi:histidine phosphatase family protein [Nanoarchaeota archaeon]
MSEGLAVLLRHEVKRKTDSLGRSASNDIEQGLMLDLTEDGNARAIENGRKTLEDKTFGTAFILVSQDRRAIQTAYSFASGAHLPNAWETIIVPGLALSPSLVDWGHPPSGPGYASDPEGNSQWIVGLHENHYFRDRTQPTNEPVPCMAKNTYNMLMAWQQIMERTTWSANPELDTLVIGASHSPLIDSWRMIFDDALDVDVSTRTAMVNRNYSGPVPMGGYFLGVIEDIQTEKPKMVMTFDDNVKVYTMSDLIGLTNQVREHLRA